MLFIVVAIHFIRLCQGLSNDQLSDVLNPEQFNQDTLAFVGEHISDVTLDFSAPLAFLDGVSSGKDNIYKSLVTYASEHLKHN